MHLQISLKHVLIISINKTQKINHAPNLKCAYDSEHLLIFKYWKLNGSIPYCCFLNLYLSSTLMCVSSNQFVGALPEANVWTRQNQNPRLETFFSGPCLVKKKKNPKSPDLMPGHSGIPGSLSSRSAFHFCTKAEHEPDLVLICKCNGISSFTCSLKKIVDLTHLKGIVV